jgi:signal transduction histidine kinase
VSAQQARGEARPTEHQSGAACTEADLMRGAVPRLGAADARRVRLDAPAAGEATGRWDPVGLDRVADNLLPNALKYSPSDAPVVVAVRRRATRSS